MSSQTFFKLFPPPKFLDMPYAGLDISDDAIHCLEYSHTFHGLSIHRYGMKELPSGVIVGGEIEDKKILSEIITSLVKELKIYSVKVSLPEEKIYLFKTDVPNASEEEIRQNVEFKLEENVPISPAESIFFFDLIPNSLSASVSVAPRELVMSYLEVLKSAGLTVVSFEAQPRAITRSLISHGSTETQIIVHIMNQKTGIYVICGEVVCFTSTVVLGKETLLSNSKTFIEELKKHLVQVLSYWVLHGQGTKISHIIFSGYASLTNSLVEHCSPDIPVEIGKVWQNAFSHENYIPPISYEDSLDYAVAIGLAMPTT